jgi:hypothetical protein
MQGAGIILKRIAQGKNHCKNCGWDGDKLELIPTDVKDLIGKPVCPNCKKSKVVSSETLARDHLQWVQAGRFFSKGGPSHEK